METVLEYVRALLPYLPFLLPILAGIIGLAVRGELDDYARATVAAAYRVGIHAADTLADEGVAWLRGEAGVAYRRHLAERGYDLLPDRLGPVPVGLVKLVVSREQWCEMVELAFQQAVEMAEKLELPHDVQG